MRAGGSGFAGRGKRINQPTKGKLAFISDSERMINCDLAGIHKKQFVDIQRFLVFALKGPLA